MLSIHFGFNALILYDSEDVAFVGVSPNTYCRLLYWIAAGDDL